MWKLFVVAPVVLLLGCTSEGNSVDTTQPDRQTEEAAPEQTDPPTTSVEVAPADSVADAEDDAIAGCPDGEPTEIGAGLTAILPIGAVYLGGGGSAVGGDRAQPMASFTYDVDGVRLDVGRILLDSVSDSSDGPAPTFQAERTEDGVRLFAESSERDYADCVLTSLSYDPETDTAR